MRKPLLAHADIKIRPSLLPSIFSCHIPNTTHILRYIRPISYIATPLHHIISTDQPPHYPRKMSAPATTEAQGQTYKFNASMSCGGCSGAIDRVLKKLPGMLLSPSRSSQSHHPSTAPYTSSLFLIWFPPVDLPATMTNTITIGVKSHTVSLEDQTAIVEAEPSLAYETVLKTIKKTGKTVNAGAVKVGDDWESKSIELEE